MSIETGSMPTQQSGDPGIQQLLLLSAIQHQLEQNNWAQQLILEKLTYMNEMQDEFFENGVDVSLTSLDLSFGNMVTFILMWTFASIPAVIIISILYFLVLSSVISVFTQ